MDYSILVNKDNPLPRAYIQNKLDLTGYVDKDVEQVITRGQEVYGK